jgi:uncharacterized protein YndB with AHSA1/START domain
MNFEHQIRYDAPPERVYAMLTDRSFREQVCDAQRVLEKSVTIAPNGAGTTVTVDQKQRAAGIPSFAQKVVGDQIHIVQKESWTTASDADLEVGIPGKPGHLLGTVTLRPEGTGTVQTVTGEIKVNIPLVGGKLEKLIADMLARALDTENRVGHRWLAG